MSLDTTYSGEDALFNAVADGDDLSFRILFNRFSKKFYGAAFKISGSHYLSEEVVQETFIRVWDKRERFRDLENPEGYLFTLFYHCMSQRLRKEAEAQHAMGKVIEMPVQDELNGEEKQLLEKKYQLLEMAVSQLPLQQAEVFKLIKEKGFSREEAAAQLNISPNTVRNHLAAAIRTLKKLAVLCFLFGGR